MGIVASKKSDIHGVRDNRAVYKTMLSCFGLRKVRKKRGEREGNVGCGRENDLYRYCP